MASIFLGPYRVAFVEKNDITLIRITDGKRIVLSTQDCRMLMDINEKVMSALKNKDRFYRLLSKSTNYVHSIKVYPFEGYSYIVFIETIEGKRISSVGLTKQHYEKLFKHIKRKYIVKPLKYLLLYIYLLEIRQEIGRMLEERCIGCIERFDSPDTHTCLSEVSEQIFYTYGFDAFIRVKQLLKLKLVQIFQCAHEILIKDGYCVFGNILPMNKYTQMVERCSFLDVWDMEKKRLHCLNIKNITIQIIIRKAIFKI
jgi:hypothetical protein